MVVEGEPMDATTALPTGTVTFLFTDIEGSTRLWEQHPQAMREALARHNALLAHGIHQYGGQIVKSRGEGDSFFAVFSRATDAVAAACFLQQALQAEPWPADTPLRVRMALHTGEADLHDGDYYGPALNRCARLRAVAHGEQVLLSLATAAIVRQALPDGAHLVDLGCHGLADLAQPEQVFQLTHPALASEFPPLQSLDARPRPTPSGRVPDLPVQPTPLIGRDDEVRAVMDLLRRAEVRLVTLTGPGGTGKTRLALQVAADLLDEFIDGVFFVDLAPIRDARPVTSTISHTLGVRESGGQPLIESLRSTLRDRRLLLLLDNFEQVIEAAPVVADLLAAAVGLKVLVTSRTALRLRGEYEFAVSPLALPDPKRLPPVESLSQYAAVELFIQRAIAAKSGFRVTNENAPAVAEICVRLDGLPLAIELAAARIKLFSPRALLSRLENRLKVLTDGARDLPARQQTLRHTVAWSYDLLNEGERQLFHQVSVFVGGWTLEAAEAVCDVQGALAIDVLDGLASLAEKSLLRQEEAAGEPRFGMLETIREYARERLEASGEAERVRRQHADFFLALAEEAGLEFPRPWEESWLERLEREHGNLHAALDHFIARGEIEAGLRLGAAFWTFWLVRGWMSEGQQRLTQLLESAQSVLHTAVGAKALRGVGYLALIQRDHVPARKSLEQSLAIARELGDRERIAWALADLGALASNEREFRAARSLHEESLAIQRERDDKAGIAFALQGLGNACRGEGDLVRARAFLKESLAISRECGAWHMAAWTLLHLGELSRQQDDLVAARGSYQSGLALFRERGDKMGTVTSLQLLAQLASQQQDWENARLPLEEALALSSEMGARLDTVSTLAGLARVASGQGDHERAVAHWRGALVVARDLDHKQAVGDVLHGLARAYHTAGEPRRAAQLLGAVDAARQVLEGPVPAGEHRVDDRLWSAVRAALDEAGEPRFGASRAPASRRDLGGSEAAEKGAERQRQGPDPGFAAAWAAGRAMSLDAAVAFALDDSSASLGEAK
jgi:predicted ATPase/class 3 adenylate cyclase